MRVLQITNDFNYQKLYINLFESKSSSIEQTVFCGARDKRLIGNNIKGDIANINYHNPLIVRKWDKINYFGKALRQFRYIKNNIDLSKIDLIHSHTLFSDGFIAYLIYLKYKIPYVTAVRSTDVNTFFKYKPYLIPLAKRICRNSSSLIFPALTVQSKFESKFKHFKYKSYLINNPLDQFWLENIYRTPRKYSDSKDFKVLYVGKIDKNKNVLALTSAIKKLNTKRRIILHIVGQFNSENIKNKVLSYDFVTYTPHTESKEKLMQYYRDSHLLCLPSKKETFGLVCLEALSQGTPYLMREGQGLFGMINGSLYSNYFKTDDDIEVHLSKIMMEYKTLKINTIDFTLFDVKNVCGKEISIYANTLKG